MVLELSIVRVFTPEGKIAGSGFLVSDKYILTWVLVEIREAHNCDWRFIFWFCHFWVLYMSNQLHNVYLRFAQEISTTSVLYKYYVMWH